MQETNLLASVLGITLVAILWWYAKRARTSPYKSPGPPALPIIGHLLSIPLHDQAETYQKWGKRYGTSATPSPGSGSPIQTFGFQEMC